MHDSIRSRRKATRKVKTCPTPANIENLCIIWAKTRCTIKSTKRKSWQSFVPKVSSRTSIKKVWTMIRKITGKLSASPIRHLKVNNVEVSDFPDIANTIALHTYIPQPASSSTHRNLLHTFVITPTAYRSEPVNCVCTPSF